mgnify:CR=1 FL=1
MEHDGQLLVDTSLKIYNTFTFVFSLQNRRPRSNLFESFSVLLSSIDDLRATSAFAMKIQGKRNKTCARARARERGKRIDEKRGQVGFRRKHPSIRMPGIGRGAFLNDPFTKSLRDVAWNFRDGEFSTESTAVNKVYVSEHARYLNVISHNKHSCNILD